MPPAAGRPTEMTETTELLNADTVGAYLCQQGLIADVTPVHARALGGGVSNVVLAVDTGEGQLVVKQSLEQLRVREQWTAPRDRVITESEGLQLARGLTPDAVPAVLRTDAERCVIVIEQAPAGWTDWKSQLLTQRPGFSDLTTSARLGELLGTWQSATVTGLGPRFADPSAFEALRVDPYYRAAARRRPEYATALGWYAEQLTSRRRCLSHGDFSPKNVLVGDSGLWVIDFEVAHLGDPAFDLAFLLSHLLLKSLHQPGWSDRYAACAESFTDSYSHAANPALAPGWDYVAGHVGCLLLARVHGKSPAEYLTGGQRHSASRLGAALVAQQPAQPRQLWDVLARIEESA